MIRALCTVSLAGLVLAAFSAGAQAAVAPSRARAESPRDRDVERVHRLLREEQVARRLAAMGMGREEIEKRLERMNDAEVRQLAERLEDLAIGRDGAGIVIGLLLLVALVLLIIFLYQRV